MVQGGPFQEGRKSYIHFKCDSNIEQSLREVIAVYVRLPHEVLARDYVRRQHLYARRGIDPADYSFDAYLKHPVTLEFGAPNVFPVGYYTDKVALGKNDNFIRGACNVLWVRKRITLWLIRGSLLCKCGCGGACTVDAFQVEMNNSLNHLQRQQYLPHRLDGRAWLPGDAHRASLSTSPLEIRGAVCEY